MFEPIVKLRRFPAGAKAIRNIFCIYRFLNGRRFLYRCWFLGILSYHLSRNGSIIEVSFMSRLKK